MSAIQITEEMLCELRREVQKELSEARFRHTLGVEQTARELAALYCPDMENELCAAALLHDITKEQSFEAQAEILHRHGMAVTEEYTGAPATLHAVSAAAIIAEKYPSYADDKIINAVRYHTTGRAGMTLYEKIIYIADFIEPYRKHQICIDLRRAFFDAEPQKMNIEDRLLHLDNMILKSLDSTLEHLKIKGSYISPYTQSARDSLAGRRETNGRNYESGNRKS